MAGSLSGRSQRLGITSAWHETDMFHVWAMHVMVLRLNKELTTIDKDTGRSSLSEPHNSDM